MKKWLEYMVSELFSNRKCCALGPWLGRPRLLRSTGRWQLIGAWPRGHSRAREHIGGSTTERGGHKIPARASPGLGQRQKAQRSSRERGKGAVRALGAPHLL
jgi:hypothetical protein